MAVQISKKRKVRSWAWGPGDCSAVGVRAFSRCRRGARSSVLCPGEWLGPRGIPAGCGWRWIECGARARRAQCGGERETISAGSGRRGEMSTGLLSWPGKGACEHFLVNK